MTHICVNKLTIIGSHNGLSPGRRQAIIWTNAVILLTGPLGTNFSEMSIEMHIFPSKKMHLKVSSVKCRPFCVGLNVLSDKTGLDIKHLVYMPIRHVVLKMYVPCKNFDVPSQYLYKPCKAYIYCWKNKYMPRLKNHLPSRAHNHKNLCALGQDLHAPGTKVTLQEGETTLVSLFHFQFPGGLIRERLWYNLRTACGSSCWYHQQTSTLTLITQSTA